MHKLAQLNLNNTVDRAYLHGFQTKLAEYGLTLEDFVELQEKTAAAGGMINRLTSSFGEAKKLPGAFKTWNKRRQGANALEESGRIFSAKNQRGMNNEILKAQMYNAAPALAVGGGGLALAGTGVAYGAGDADTTGNQMRQMSNRHLGTDFDTESRFGAMFG